MEDGVVACKMVKEVKRPWGDFKQFALNEKCTVKILEVKPRRLLSLQKHKKRKELWYFLTSGYVQIGDKISKVNKNSIVVIPKMKSHRLIAKEKKVNQITLESTITARGFYQKFGFMNSAEQLIVQIGGSGVRCQPMKLEIKY